MACRLHYFRRDNEQRPDSAVSRAAGSKPSHPGKQGCTERSTGSAGTASPCCADAHTLSPMGICRWSLVAVSSLANRLLGYRFSFDVLKETQPLASKVSPEKDFWRTGCRRIRRSLCRMQHGLFKKRPAVYGPMEGLHVPGPTFLPPKT